MSDNSLKILAGHYNEQYHYLYIDKPLLEKEKVNIQVINYEQNKNIDPYEHRNMCKDTIIRVNIVRREYNFLKEIKWEGRLQDWYKACSENAESVAGYKED